jgi:hypothetical protein
MGPLVVPPSNSVDINAFMPKSFIYVQLFDDDSVTVKVYYDDDDTVDQIIRQAQSVFRDDFDLPKDRSAPYDRLRCRSDPPGAYANGREDCGDVLEPRQYYFLLPYAFI